MTFSIVARCEETGQFGVAISSSSPAVAARCAWAQPGIGAVATQNVTNPALGPKMLEELAKGAKAADAVVAARQSDSFPDYRQLLAIDAQGNTAIHSGPNALGIWTSAAGRLCVAAGNLLANDGVPRAMVETFETTSGSLGDRLIAALKAAVNAGGEAGPVRSAGLLIVDKETWPYAELRIDWMDEGCPISAVAQAWEVYRPQAQDYVTRALNPLAAPSYGVPGDE
ncbi:DUF1028 domain-containing protein [Agrobacterium vitis]|uniref:DUF1028 domain-containing protein n=1 Tax=Agrobacterium vitis TaxID=373 RepID=UPI00087272A7|nr:DUF1028 domain-containing protein [Agrobacterium vitis]MCE6076766.1 DUF1028 domain-containing protein [Agrobacterium vitis]MCM2452216.1 DUF1028 domain-containing protein [Agrobacterium vitis]MCM2471054.1 DUF1028 domain-containing protein [Agrobacterium vitis]MUO71151.1 DUF1028 domain-containing protein [Agrobacterium vitis]MUO84386.1 DUF1028 domain-containing protein [Agrobacterium vitis]